MLTFYFDNAATTKIKPEVLSEMMPYLREEYGNPSSLYGIGRSAKRAIDTAREKVAKLINCDKYEIYFTGCGTESDNTALKGIAYRFKDSWNKDVKNTDEAKSEKNHIITTKIEHHAILESCKNLEKQGFEITYLDVDKDGLINLQELENAIKEETILISIMFANNEIGTIEPIEKIAELAKQKNVIFHTDAVQAIGNTPINVKELGIDMLSLSGHKIHAPKGIGALYVRKGIEFDSFMNGGHQEKNKRAGTENLAGIVGLGKACELAKENLEYHIKHVRGLRDYYIEQVLKNIKNVKINGSMKYRLPGNANISFIGIDSTALLLELDKAGVCCSSGSACNSSEATPSHVLTAIGLDSETAKSALRVTFGEFNTRAEVDYLLQNLKQCVMKLRNLK
ncbi:MAG: cysteine desulfurase NifS [Clostridia bacterium]|nr:cysteine desulfurase NifS [Clostridia bacterium]